jgi:hypothetical protein
MIPMLICVFLVDFHIIRVFSPTTSPVRGGALPVETVLVETRVVGVEIDKHPRDQAFAIEVEDAAKTAARADAPLGGYRLVMSRLCNLATEQSLKTQS